MKTSHHHLTLAVLLLAAGLVCLWSAVTAGAASAAPASPEPENTSLSSLPWNQWQLFDPSGAAADHFGHSAAISGDTAVVGAPWDDDGSSVDEGTVTVYVREGLNWNRQAQLTGSGCGSGSHFGASVSISGDTIVVGAPDENGGSTHQYQGAAYVFTRSGTTWTQQARLADSRPTVADHFGTAVAISGDRIVVGAPGYDNQFLDRGRVYFYHRSGTTWTEQYATCMLANSEAQDAFGNAVAISGTTAVVGAEADDLEGAPEAGSVWVFDGLSDTGWARATQLFAPGADAQDNFGHSVAICGDDIVVGADMDDDNGLNSGAAYAFQRSGTSWYQWPALTPNDQGAGDHFGHSVAIAGNVMVVGAYSDDIGAVQDAGTVQAFARYNLRWRKWQGELTAGACHTADGFGSAAALSDAGLAVVGSPQDDFNANADQGQAFIINCCDDTAPTTQAIPSGGLTEWTTGPVTIRFTATDDRSGVQRIAYRLSTGGTYTTYDDAARPVVSSNGSNYVEYYSEDVTGNIEQSRFVVVKIDKVAPATMLGGVPSGWANGPVTATFAPWDGQSGMQGGQAKTQYSTNGGSTWTTGTSTTVSAEGVTTLLYRSTDALGNVETIRSSEVKIDMTPPVTTVRGIPAGWIRTPVALEFTVEDELSGMDGGEARTEFSSDRGATWTTSADTTFSADGITALEYRSVDAAGNVESAQSVEVKIDATAPTTTASGVPAGWSKSPVTVAFAATDAASGMTGGMAKTEFSTDGGVTWTAGTSATVSSQGVSPVLYRSTDAAGNTESVGTVEVKIDSTGPATKAYRASVVRGRKVRLGYQVTDPIPGSGSSTVTLKIFKRAKLVKQLTVPGAVVDSARHTYAWRCKLAKGRYTVRVFATDAAGNAQSSAGKATLTVK